MPMLNVTAFSLITVLFFVVVIIHTSYGNVVPCGSRGSCKSLKWCKKTCKKTGCLFGSCSWGSCYCVQHRFSYPEAPGGSVITEPEGPAFELPPFEDPPTQSPPKMPPPGAPPTLLP